MDVLDRPSHEPSHVAARRIAAGLWTTERRNALPAGTRLRQIEVVQYLEWTCAGPFLSSVGRYAVVDGAPGEIAEITHATAHEDSAPVARDHPDIERVDHTRPGR